MSTTLKVSSGDLVVDHNTGQLSTIDSIEKGSQDVARHLLTAYNAFFDEGNELIGINVDTSVVGLTDALAVQFIMSCLTRLIIKQQLANDEQRIIKVTNIKTRKVDLTTLVFLVDVLYENGTTSRVANLLNLAPTELNQLITGDSLLKV